MLLFLRPGSTRKKDFGQIRDKRTEGGGEGVRIRGRGMGEGKAMKSNYSAETKTKGALQEMTSSRVNYDRLSHDTSRNLASANAPLNALIFSENLHFYSIHLRAPELTM